MRYLKTFNKGRIIIDTNYFDHSNLKSQEHETWRAMYPNAKDEIPPKMPHPMGKKVRITAYVDADHAHDLVTQWSVSGIIIFLNKTPVKWYCKRQNTAETSTYGSELVAARIAVELILEVIYFLRMIGVNIDGPAIMLGDNMSVILNTSVPSSVLKKKHNAIAYHKVREAIAASIIRFHHVRSEDNIADVLTKPLGFKTMYHLTSPWFFQSPLHLEMLKDQCETDHKTS